MMWFGLIGAPLAWAFQHVFGISVIEAACNPPSPQWGVPVDSLTLTATVVAAIVATLSAGAAFMVYRATKDAGTQIPEARARFLAIVGIVVSPLFLSIVLMSGITVVAFPECTQS
jgi:hypothetical protein